MNKRALLIVIDSVGCGNAPDAAEYGDLGADTLGHLLSYQRDFSLPALNSLGLERIQVSGNFHQSRSNLKQRCYRLTEKSCGKDTVTGHWELMGCLTEQPLFTCDSFPLEFVAKLEAIAGSGFLGNKKASGTEILVELGGEHLRSGKPILYTSADSVLQIAAHEEVYGLERLYCLCEKARQLLDQEGIRVGRVIARPFLGSDALSFERTSNRHDYSLKPKRTVLNDLVGIGVEVTGIGKIHDIFAGSGICSSIPTKSNEDGMKHIEDVWARERSNDELIFCNLVDFDSLYGHRRDPDGYANCLREFDSWLGSFLPKVGKNDLLIITADHGNDPYHHGTDHTREQVPCFVVGAADHDFGELREFSDVSRCLEQFFCQK
ncbi:MAG: phosphopentomutase [Akkermansiaceae bacterium]